MQKQAVRVVRNRRAETRGVALTFLVARTAGVDAPTVIVALATVIGFAPAGTTWLVNVIGVDAKPVAVGG